MYSLQCRRERVCRRPRRFQEVETDLAGLEVDVWVADGSCEGDSGRGEGIGGRNEDVEVPETGWEGSISRGAGGKIVTAAVVGGGGRNTFVSCAGETLHNGFPVQYFRL